MRTAYTSSFTRRSIYRRLFTRAARPSRSVWPADVHPRHAETVKASSSISGPRYPSRRLLAPRRLHHRQHLNHVTFNHAYFTRKLVAFGCCMAHWLDIGGSAASCRPHLYRVCRSRCEVSQCRRGQSGHHRHHPHELPPARFCHGDLRAQVTALTTGERRFTSWSNAMAPMPCSLGCRDHDHTEAKRARIRVPFRRRLRSRIFHGRRRLDLGSACRSACASRSRASA